MNSRAALGCVQDQTGLGAGAVGDRGSFVRIDGGVGFAGGDDRNAARREQRAQPHTQRQGDVLFKLPVGQPRPRVAAAVGRVEHHDKARLRSGL